MSKVEWIGKLGAEVKGDAAGYVAAEIDNDNTESIVVVTKETDGTVHLRVFGPFTMVDTIALGGTLQYLGAHQLFGHDLEEDDG